MNKHYDGFYYGFDGIEVFSPYVDEYGKPVKRTKYSHPYTYDGFVVWRGGSNTEITSNTWSDRLFGWDYKKTKDLIKKHFDYNGGRADWNNSTAVEALLREFLDLPDLKLILIMEYCNQSSGYPVWRFDFGLKKKEERKKED